MQLKAPSYSWLSKLSAFGYTSKCVDCVISKRLWRFISDSNQTQASSYWVTREVYCYTCKITARKLWMARHSGDCDHRVIISDQKKDGWGCRRRSTWSRYCVTRLHAVALLREGMQSLMVYSKARAAWASDIERTTAILTLFFQVSTFSVVQYD